MDFSFSEEQEAVRELAERIFTDLSTPERLRQFESEPEGDRFDRKLWGELAAAGLLGIALPEAVGGAGLGFVETGLLAEATGRSAAYVPTVETLAAAAAAVAEFGTDAQRQQWLPGVVAGETVLTTALVELGGVPRRRRWWPSATGTDGSCPDPRPACRRGRLPMPCWSRRGSSRTRPPCSSWAPRRPAWPGSVRWPTPGSPRPCSTSRG